MELECGHTVPDVFAGTYTVPQWQEVKVPFLGIFKRKEYQLLPTEVKRRSINCIKCGAEKAIV